MGLASRVPIADRPSQARFVVACEIDGGPNHAITRHRLDGLAARPRLADPPGSDRSVVLCCDHFSEYATSDR